MTNRSLQTLSWQTSKVGKRLLWFTRQAQTYVKSRNGVSCEYRNPLAQKKNNSHLCLLLFIHSKAKKKTKSGRKIGRLGQNRLYQDTNPFLGAYNRTGQKLRTISRCLLVLRQKLFPNTRQINEASYSLSTVLCCWLKLK